MPVFEKNYKIAAGELKIKITYWSTVNGVLDFGIINIGELEYGYEDEDQLTFFPNVFRMEFTDFDRKNYAILKYSLDNYPEQKHEDTGRVEVFLNGSIYPIYDGYIDQETLTYDEEKRVTSFEAVDFILELKNITTFNMADNPNANPPALESIPSVLWKIYRKVYPELPETMTAENITNNIATFNSSSFRGIYWDHNWIFKGKRRVFTGPNILTDYYDVYETADWKYDFFAPRFAFYVSFWNNYPAGTLAELVKQLGKEFGALIGSTQKNKIFFKKRYFYNQGSYEELDSKIISESFSKTLFLKPAKNVRNNHGFLEVNEGLGTLSPGYDKNPNRGSTPANAYNNIDITTYFGTLADSLEGDPQFWNTNVEIKKGSYNYRVSKSILDPDIVDPEIVDPEIVDNNRRIQELITYYTLKSRERSRDKYEMELYGTDYDLSKSYRLNIATGGTRYLRPMVIKKNLLTNTTSMTALEVGL